MLKVDIESKLVTDDAAAKRATTVRVCVLASISVKPLNIFTENCVCGFAEMYLANIYFDDGVESGLSLLLMYS